MSLKISTRAFYHLQRFLTTQGLVAGLQWLIRQMWLDLSCDCGLDVALSLCCIKESSVFASAITFFTVGDVGSRH